MTGDEYEQRQLDGIATLTAIARQQAAARAAAARTLPLPRCIPVPDQIARWDFEVTTTPAFRVGKLRRLIAAARAFPVSPDRTVRAGTRKGRDAYEVR